MKEEDKIYLDAWNVVIRVLAECDLDDYVPNRNEDIAKAYDEILQEIRQQPVRMESEIRMREQMLERIRGNPPQGGE